ncbi:hypothetical protein FRB95_000429 [Tulasnella sp. JGI-2019a]|nr:hypothetical protein FRB95_000429 [Tulasnella sp. JGI-2019a]
MLPLQTQIAILAVLAAGSALGAPLNNHHGRSRVGPSRISARDLSSKQQELVYALRNDINGWNSQMSQMTPDGQAAGLRAVAKFDERLAHDEKVDYDSSSGKEIQGARRLAEDDNIAKLGRVHRKLVAHRAKKVSDELTNEAKNHHSRRAAPLDEKHQDLANQLRLDIQNWRTEIPKLDAHGQAAVLKKVKQFTHTLGRREGKPFNYRPDMSILDEASRLTLDENIAMLRNKTIDFPRVVQQAKEVTDKIQFEAKHHTASVTASSVDNMSEYPGNNHNTDAASVPTEKRSVVARELNPQQQDYAYTLRAAINDWRNELAKLDSQGQEKALKDLNDFLEYLAKAEGMPYTGKTGLDAFQDADTLSQDINVSKLALSWLQRHRLAHKSKEVYDQLAHEMKKHSVSDAA